MNALLLYGGPGIAAGKPGVASAGVFAGENALGANLAMKQIAEKALAAGKDPDEVRRVTGWFTGMEGKPRFEIGDEVMGLQPGFAEALTPKKGLEGFFAAPQGERMLSEVIDHPTLFNSYPELKNTKVVFDKKEGAAFDPENNIIHLQKEGVNLGMQNTWLDSVSHEVQHWVQKKEGFARGGNAQKIGNNQYERLAGEIEARDVSARRTWDAEMREAVPPDLRKDAIIRWGGKESEEIFMELVR